MKFAKLSLAVLSAAFLAGCAANDGAMEKSDKAQCCSDGSAAGKACCSDGAAKTGECCSEGTKTEKAAEKPAN